MFHRLDEAGRAPSILEPSGLGLGDPRHPILLQERRTRILRAGIPLRLSMSLPSCFYRYV
jgi:hypothetical protein